MISPRLWGYMAPLQADFRLTSQSGGKRHDYIFLEDKSVVPVFFAPMVLQ